MQFKKFRALCRFLRLIRHHAFLWGGWSWTIDGFDHEVMPIAWLGVFFIADNEDYGHFRSRFSFGWNQD